jgi:hypothetical protein
VAIPWTDPDRLSVAQAIADHPIDSGRCAALARRVLAVAMPIDTNARGVQLKPRAPARWLVPKHPHVPYWSSHTLIETREHDVDAITGPDGHRADAYLEHFWHFPDRIDARTVDVATIDPGIEDDGS